MQEKSGKRAMWIVISEDDPDDHYLFKSACLEVNSDFRIHHVLTGRELVQTLLESAVYGASGQHDLPAMIIADLKKPFFDLETIREIKVYTQFRNIPIFLFSMDGAESVRLKALEAGASAFFKKPATYFDLKQIIRQLVQRSRN